VYANLQKNGDPFRAAIQGTQQIATPVTFGVLTTVAAFLPLLLIDGRRGPIFAQIPMVVIPVLLFSLIESKFVLPSHLRNMSLRKEPEKLDFLTRLQQKIAGSLVWFIQNIYRPFLNTSLNWRYLTVSIFISVLILTIALVASGRFKYTFFPRIESEIIAATIEMPEGTSIEVTEKYVNRMVAAVEKMQEKYVEEVVDGEESDSKTEDTELALLNEQAKPKKQGRKLIQHILVTVGSAGRRPRGSSGVSNIATVTFETIPPEQRTINISSRALVAEWQRLIGPVPGVKELSFRAELGRGGEPIDVQLKGNDIEELNEVALLVKDKLGEYDGLFDIKNSFEGGKDDIGQGSTTISRVDRQRIINVTADLNKEKIAANTVVADLKEWFPSIVDKYPGVAFDMEGEQREQAKFGSSLAFGFTVALIAIYILLAIPFGSYFQPLIVMSIIPFSIIGAIGGHSIMGISLSISSIMGLLALIGVVVNDSLVLVDYTNKLIKSGIPVAEAVRQSGGARFRPILLTSLTTFAGLTPLITEKSTQAQFLIPMAVSLGFGILFATLLTLVLIPSFYLIVEDFKSVFKKIGAFFGPKEIIQE